MAVVSNGEASNWAQRKLNDTRDRLVAYETILLTHKTGWLTHESVSSYFLWNVNDTPLCSNCSDHPIRFYFSAI